jgi:tRNA-modifying protein YgfZ
MLSSFRIVADADDLLLILPADRLAATLKRLQMFVLRAKVTLGDDSEQIARIELSGECAADLLPIDPPQADNGVTSGEGYCVVRIPGDRPRFLVLGEPGPIQALWEEAAQTAQPTRREAWALLDIRAGLPSVYESTSDAFVPQMANLQLVDGVSFTKGCYTGQEVVARMQYLGKLKRRMYRAHVQATQPPQAGDELFSPSSESGQGAGRVVDAAPSPDGGFEALVVTPIASADAGDLQLYDAQGPALTILGNPYPFAD